MSDTRLALIEAIVRKLPIIALYNGNVMKLAPHLLFERHGSLFLSALNMSKRWRSDDQRYLGHFKLDGLSVTELGDETFAPLASFQATPPHADDRIILAV